MAPGSVIVDLAAERGGNCELTRGGECVVEHGVTIVGWFNLAQPGALSCQPDVRAEPVSAFLLHLVKDGKLHVNLDDEIIRDTLLTRGGEIVNTRIRDVLSPPAVPGQGQGS